MIRVGRMNHRATHAPVMTAKGTRACWIANVEPQIGGVAQRQLKDQAICDASWRSAHRDILFEKGTDHTFPGESIRNSLRGAQMLAEPRCFTRRCVHFRGVSQPDGTEDTERVVCAAFPEGIPGEIAYGRNPHTKPFPGDNGIQYQKGPDDPDER
jgi:hypothetical protein